MNARTWTFLFIFLVISAIKHLIDRKYDTAKIRAELQATLAQNARYEALIFRYQGQYGAEAKRTAEKFKATGYWKTLGIQPTRDKGEILKAFRSKAQTAHPDKGGNAHKFQQLFEARNTALKEIGAR